MFGHMFAAAVATGLCYAWYRWSTILFYALSFLRIKLHTKNFCRKNMTVADIFARRVLLSPDQACVVFEGREYTYAEMDRLSNRVANWALAKGLKSNDVVALMMSNQPAFIYIWVGLCKAGCVVALVNTSVRRTSLLHIVRTSEAKTFIFEDLYTEAVSAIVAQLDPSISLWVHTREEQQEPPVQIDGRPTSSLDRALERGSDAPICPSVRAAKTSFENVFYIYTSGTTGLPKAAKIPHNRFYMAGVSFAAFHGIVAADRIYCPLPLYHSAAGMIGLSTAWQSGAAIVLRNKFSASKFFQDCHENRCTVIQYIGQICRYLLNAPASEYDRRHTVTKAIGNGLNRDVWQKFQSRFGIDYIGEFYASTEGNCNLTCVHFIPSPPGALGYIPWIAKFIYPIKIVKFDHGRQEAYRNANGRCEDVDQPGVGELIGKIIKSQPLRNFAGYTNREDTNKKILRNVISDGDSWFRTGDLVKFDENGFIFFVDRVGDTFRWKGENVSTGEVENVFGTFPGFEEVNVYGVHVPGNDGRAGMVSLVMTAREGAVGEEDEKEDMEREEKEEREREEKRGESGERLTHVAVDFRQLFGHLKRELAIFQQPLFLRFQRAMDVTGTFKHRKVDLVEQGFDITRVTDPVYFRDDRAGTFVPLSQSLYQDIISGAVRL